MNYKRWMLLTLLSAVVAGCATTDMATLSLGENASPEQQAQFSSLKQNAANSDPEAQFVLGKMLETGSGIPRDVGEAAEWYRRAADHGHAAAQFHLGAMYGRGEGVRRDHSEAVRWHQRAAGAGYRDALYPVAYAYEHGIGVSKNPEDALLWYRKSADQGVHYAMDRIARAYALGELGLSADSVQAEEWRSRAKVALGTQKTLEMRTGK